MQPAAAPALSAILVTFDNYTILRTTIEHLRAQTARDQMELVIVAPRASTLHPDMDALNDFGMFQVVEASGLTTYGKGWAAGIRAARAPVVVQCEDHCFPDPEWAAALIEAHQGPWAAVGPEIRNGPPETILTRGQHTIYYGPWDTPLPAGEIEMLPGHNTSYKLAVLRDYDDKLDYWLDNAFLLHLDMRRRGYRLYAEPRARVHHVSPDLVSTACLSSFAHGRIFAAVRAEHWSMPHRGIYTLGTTILPFLRLWRLRRQLASVPRQAQRLHLIATVFWLLAFSALGEAAGYALGAGQAQLLVIITELDRIERFRQRKAPAST